MPYKFSAEWRVDADWLREKILNDGWTYHDVAKQIGVSKERVRQYCLKLGITLDQRTARWYAKYRGISELESPEWLLRQKQEGISSIEALARKLKVSTHFLEAQIKRLGLDSKDFQYKTQTITLPCGYCGKLITRRLPTSARENIHINTFSVIGLTFGIGL